jgi:hypothetical protein
MQPFPPPGSPPEYEVLCEPNVMVPLRDGVRLATDVYRPARGGKPLPGRLPVLLHRTPYNKEELERASGYCHWFAERGYIAVTQDCRGCYRSEGDTDFLLPEAQDGFDTMAWLKGQPWAGPKVGTWGTSWMGWTQTALAGLGPDNLGAMLPNMSGANGYTSSIRHGGALELRFIAWAFWHSALNTQARLKHAPHISPALNLGALGFRDWLARWPIRPGQTQLKLVPPYERWAFELLTHADYDAYWEHPSVNPSRHWRNFPAAPTLYVGGWYDSYARATFESFNGHGAVGRGPVKVLVGPWTHGLATAELTYAGDVEFGEAAALPSFRELHRRWFDFALKGEGAPPFGEAPIRLFVMGGGGGYKTGTGRLFHGGRWRDEARWPLERTRWTEYFLHGDGTLSPQRPQPAASATTYRYDPASPVPSIGGSVSSLAGLHSLPPGVDDPAYAPRTTRSDEVMAAGGFDQVESPRFFGCKPPYLPLGARPDVLVFQSAPLEHDSEVTGPVEVKLWVASSALDTDFTAKLIDVYPPSQWYPNGYHLNLTDIILRLRYRNGDGKADFLPPGTAAEITLTLYPTSNLFARGHRIRLDVSSSNFPRFDPNPNTGEPIGRERQRVVANNTVFHEAGRATRVILPVIPG